MRKVLIFAAILFFSCSARVLLAAPSDIRIAEIMYDASGSDTGHEWVELWNGGSEPVTIVGGTGAGSWRFNDGANHTFSTAPASGSLTLPAGDFLIISSNTDIFLSDHLGFSGNLAKVSFSLGNTSETLSLRIGTTGALWGEVAYTSSQGANGNGKTLEWNRETNVWAESANVGGSPGSFGTPVSVSPPPSENPPAPEPSPAPLPEEQSQQTADSPQPTANSAQPTYDLTADVRLSEFLPDPAGSDMEEWIEIYNPMDRVADLSGWKIDDGEGGSNPFEFPSGSEIAPGVYVLLPRRQTSLQLNNDLDSVRLLRPDGAVKDAVAYGEAPEGSSYAKDGIIWKWSGNPTPGAANVFLAPEPLNKDGADEEKIASEDMEEQPETAKDAPEKTTKTTGTISLEGVVIAGPGLFGTQIFYIQNETRGMQVYMYKKDFPNLSPGTSVRVTGTLGTAYGEPRLKLKTRDDIVVLGEGAEPEASKLLIDEISDADIGKLVSITGDVVDTSKSGFKVADESDKEIPVVWKSGAGEMPEIFEGDKVIVRGVLGKTTGGYRIMPRSADDVIWEKGIGKSADEAAGKKRKPWFLLIFAGCSALMSSGIIIYRRNKKVDKHEELPEK